MLVGSVAGAVGPRLLSCVPCGDDRQHFAPTSAACGRCPIARPATDTKAASARAAGAAARAASGWARNRAAAVGADEVQRVGAIEAVVDAGAAAEVEELGAAAHRDVLAVVDRLAGLRIDERSGAAAEASWPARTVRRAAPLDGGNGGSQPGQPSADDRELRGRVRDVCSIAIMSLRSRRSVGGKRASNGRTAAASSSRPSANSPPQARRPGDARSARAVADRWPSSGRRSAARPAPANPTARRRAR